MSINPIHHHCGPFNSYKKPSGAVDNICKDHDMEYEKIGPKAYLMFNKADEKFVKRMSKQKGWLPKVYSGFFKLKKHVAPHMAADPSTPVKRKAGSPPDTPPRSHKKPHADLTELPEVNPTNNQNRSGMAKNRRRNNKPPRKPRKRSSKRPFYKSKKGKRAGKRLFRRGVKKEKRGSSRFMKLYSNAKQNGLVNIKGYDTGFYGWMPTDGTPGVWGTKAMGSAVGICGVYSQKFLWDTEMEAILNLGASDTGDGKSGMFQNPPQAVISGGVVTGYAYQRNSDQEIFLIKDYVADYTFNNVTTGDIDMWFFEYHCIRSSNAETPTEVYNDYVQQQLFTGLKAPFSAPSLNTFWVDAEIMGVFGKSTRNWKLVKRVHHRLKPDGKPVKYRVHLSNVIWDREQFNNDNDAKTGSNVYHKGVSQDLVVVVRGALGYNSTSKRSGFTATDGVSMIGRKSLQGVRANVQAKQATRQVVRDATSLTAISGTADCGYTVSNPGGDASFGEFNKDSTFV